MLKLMMYDLRRSKDLILGTFVVLILIQVGIFVAADVSNWDNESMLIMNLAAYIVGGMVLLFQACRTYNYNLKAYHRRLLPLREVYTVLSPLLMFFILLLGITAMVLIHLGLYTLFDAGVLPTNLWSFAFLGLYLVHWSACFQLILLLLAVTVTRSISFKGRKWIGIATFFVMQFGVNLIGRWIFGSVNYSFDSALQFELSDEASRSNGGVSVSGEAFPILATLFEVGVAVVVVYVITILIKRRMDA